MNPMPALGGIDANVDNMVNQMQQNARQMMQYQFQMGQTTALLQAESGAISQMAKALNTTAQNLRA